DRLFGTFTPEALEPVYGTVKPLASWNPVWANFVPWVRLAEMSRRTRRWQDKLAVWWMPPEARPADLGGPVEIPQVSRATQQRYDTRAQPGVDAYVAAHFTLVTVATTALLWYEAALPRAQVAAV